MAASNQDKITDVRNSARPNTATVSAARGAGGNTLTCDNLSGWPTASKVHFVTYDPDADGNPTAGTQLDCYGIVSGNTVTSMVVVDGTDNGNANGDIAEMLPTAAWGQDLADGLTQEHNRDGTHKAVTADSVDTDTLVVNTGTTLPAGDIVTADLADSAVTTDKIADANVTSGKLAEAFARGRFQQVTTNSTQTGLTIQYGFSFIQDDGTQASVKAITFPTPFTTIYGVFLTQHGTKASNPTDITDLTTNSISDSVSTAVGTGAVTVNGFNAYIRVSTAASGTRNGFSWMAIGVV